MHALLLYFPHATIIEMKYVTQSLKDICGILYLSSFKNYLVLYN